MRNKIVNQLFFCFFFENQFLDDDETRESRESVALVWDNFEHSTRG